MNAFEDIVKLYLEEQGYWVRQSVKVDISIENKRKLGTPSMPRPEIDLVAYKAESNELLLVEVKSLLDSYGVHFNAVVGEKGSKADEKDARGYKLFNNKKWTGIVSKRLKEEYMKAGLINEETVLNYALAAGKIHGGVEGDDEKKLVDYFKKKRWILFTPDDIKTTIKSFSEKGWEDNIIVFTAKLTKESFVNAKG